MTRHFFIFAFVGLLLGWLAMHAIKLDAQQAAQLQTQIARLSVGCETVLSNEYLEKYSIVPSVKVCVTKAPVKVKHELQLVQIKSPILASIEVTPTVLPTRIWRMQNEWFKLVQALCQPANLKEVFNPVAKLRESQKRYQEGAYHWRPNAVQRRTAFSR